MVESKLIIAGVDPGTTTGYALLDLKGNVVELKSSKNLGLNGLLEEVMKIGKTVAVGTDKAKIPNLVNLFSAKTGAKVFHPKEDLRVEEKKEITKGFSGIDSHQNDALAASLLAFNRIRGILDRIEGYATENNKQSIKEKITDLVITKGVSIREAVDIIENANKEETKAMKNVIEKQELRQSDFIRIYRIIKRQEKEIALLRKQNSNLKGYASSFERRYKMMLDRNNTEIDRKMQKNLSFKDKSINFLKGRINEKDKEIARLLERMSKIDRIFTDIGEYRILKKLDNLGSSEFFKRRHLNIKKGDILLVTNPNIVSHEAIQSIKDKADAIVTKEPASKKIMAEYGLTFIDSKELHIIEHGRFASVPKAEIDMALKSKNLLKSVIESYKQQRKEEITSHL